MGRYDIVYYEGGVTIEPHFCRSYGCFGSDPNHGASLDEACAEVADHYQELADAWRNKKHPDAKYYMEKNDG